MAALLSQEPLKWIGPIRQDAIVADESEVPRAGHAIVLPPSRDSTSVDVVLDQLERKPVT